MGENRRRGKGAVQTALPPEYSNYTLESCEFSPPPTPSTTQSSCSNTFQSFVLKANKGGRFQGGKDIYEADAQVKELWLNPFRLSQNVPGAAGRAARGGCRDPSLPEHSAQRIHRGTFYQLQKEDKNGYKKKPSLISIPKTC